MKVEIPMVFSAVVTIGCAAVFVAMLACGPTKTVKLRSGCDLNLHHLKAGYFSPVNQ